MPKVDMLSLSFDEISAVDTPMNEHAIAAVAKEAEAEEEKQVEDQAEVSETEAEAKDEEEDSTMEEQVEKQADLAGIASLLRKNAEATAALTQTVQGIVDWKERTEKAMAGASEPEMPVDVYKAADGTVYSDPATIALAKQADADRAAMQQMIAENTSMTLQKRAEAELSHAPGSIEAKAALLKQIDAIQNEDTRKEVSEFVKGMNNSMSFLTRSMGTNAIPSMTSNADTVQKQAELGLLATGIITEPYVTFTKEAEKLQLDNAFEGIGMGAAMLKLAETQAGRNLLEQHYYERGQ